MQGLEEPAQAQASSASPENSLRAARLSSEQHLSPLELLPEDIARQITGELCLHDLLQLKRVSKSFGNIVNNLGLPLYLTRHQISYQTLHPRTSEWLPSDLVQRNHRVEIALKQHQWQAVQVGETWRQAVIPVLRLQNDRLLVGVGGKLFVHPIDVPERDEWQDTSEWPGGKVVGPPRQFSIAKRDQGSGADVIGIVPLSDGQVVVAQYDGTLQRIALPNHPYHGDHNDLIRSTAHYPHPPSTTLHTLSGLSDSDLLLSTTSSGLVSLFPARSPWTPPTTFEMAPNTRVWSSTLSSERSPMGLNAVLGTSRGVSLHPFHPSGFSIHTASPDPSRVLTGPDPPFTSSAYSLSLPHPTSSPFAAASITHHPTTLLSSWYDSHLRLHDLRSPSKSPTTEFCDPYAYSDGSAMYSAAFVGENWIAGGGARHGMVCLFDVRWPKKGWSAFSPGGKGSPVYALQGDGGRLWGVTEKRAFVMAFDGSADGSGENLVHPRARQRIPKMEEAVSGYRARGGKWSWSVRHNGASGISRVQGHGGREWDLGKSGAPEASRTESSTADEPGESSIGYLHADRSVNLFKSIPVLYPRSIKKP